MRFVYPVRATIVALIAAVVRAAPTMGEDVAFPPDQHPWGHFPVGSWKRVRTTAESLNDKGQVISVTITDTKTTLVAADDSTYTLHTDATVDVASRRITTAPQTARHGYYGETPGQLLAAKRTGDSSLTIDGRTIPCEVRQIVLTGDSGKLIRPLYYTSQLPPFVLR